MTKNIASSMNPYLSDLVIFYLKLHDLHWNVNGPRFVEVHKYTESRYEDTAQKLDAIAELMLMHGEKPVSTASEYGKLASIRELCEKSYRDSDALRILAEDLQLLKDKAEALRIEMLEGDIFDVAAVLETHIAEYSKELWFLHAMTV